MIVSHQHRFIFFRNGKTGTSSIGTALSGYNDVEELSGEMKGLWSTKHIPPLVARSMIGEEVWSSYFKFVFVRNPYDWVISQYRHNLKLPPIKMTEAIKNLRGFRDNLARRKAIKERTHPGPLQKEDVDHLWKWLKQFRGVPSQPSLLQSTYVQDLDKEKIVDFVGRFETLSADLQSCSERIGIPIPLLHRNKSMNRKPSDTLSTEARVRVAELWREDFEVLGYEING